LKSKDFARVTMQNLIIVESPSKAKTIKRYLAGEDAEVKASVGHIIDLPERRMGVDLDNGDFVAEYVPIPGKSKVIEEIQALSKKAKTVYLAPDPDREGEAIAFHIASIIQDAAKKAGKKVPEIYRVHLHEITSRAVKKALAHPTELNKSLYDAQQARRILDRIVGYQISPVLWKKVRRGLSAGRVQSVAVRLIVDREREIQAFKSVEYWSIEATADAKKPPLFTVKLVKVNGEKAEIPNEKIATEYRDGILREPANVASVHKKSRQRKAGPPFITSQLQQEAARALRFSPKRTMSIAQSLYEGIELGSEGAVGLITYMRTDSTRISEEALSAVRQHIEAQFGKDYLPEKPNVFRNKKSAQEAHEAIRPTSLEFAPERVKPFLKPEQFKLYKLIWDRFVASQMNSALYDQTQIEIKAGAFVLRATGSVLRFDGYLRAYREQLDADDKNAVSEDKENGILLPDLNEGDPVSLKDLKALQHFTEPPPRFSEASLVKELEEKGIGRPSTFASILSVIQDKKYVEKEDGRLKPSELGMIVTDLLVQAFPAILDAQFTAGMEEKLDKIEEGSADYVKILQEFYGPFKDSVAHAEESMRNIKRMEEPTDIPCDKCGNGHMVVKWGKTGSFLGCNNYPTCKNTMPFTRVGGKVVAQKPEKTDIICKSCGAPLLEKHGRYGKFLGCSRYPECSFTMAMPTHIKCPKPDCGGDIIVKTSKRGKPFYGCSNYPTCDFISWDKPVNQRCKICGNSYLLEKKNKSGVFSQCPTCGNQESEETKEPDAEPQN
jgi:DNA topoisomerase-1